jgi:Peptidase family M23
MLVYTALSVTLLIALLDLYLLWRAGGSVNWSLWLLVISMGVFIYLYGAWVFLSVYVRYFFVVVFLVMFVAAIAIKNATPAVTIAPGRIILNLLFSAVFILLNILYFTGTTGTAKTVNVAYPFGHGKYLVLQGGKGLPTNPFHYYLRSAIYAMDIVKLNRWGNRANAVFSQKLSDYQIFGDTLYSPCDGKVVRAVDTHPDNIPPNVVKGVGNLNMVLLETDSCYVFLGHLKQGSLVVHSGQIVHIGEPLGCAGNSGFSIEPHLHIQAHENTHTGLPWYREKPVFIRFNGTGYFLFQVINIPE